jgi:chemotaxis protein methyltransferase CheR
MAFLLPRAAELLHRRVGFEVKENKLAPVRRALLEGLASSGCRDLDDYLGELQRAALDSPLFQSFLGRVVIGETYFFRDPEFVRGVRTAVLPALIGRRAAGRRLSLWSAGCSSGEEAYTLAILAREAVPGPDWTVRVLGTDVDAQAVGRARAARYGEWALRACDEPSRLRYFLREGAQYHLRPELRSHVSFLLGNLVDEASPPLPGTLFDLIVCRNVTIYLTDPMIARVHARLRQHLSDDGVLIVGPSDPTPRAGFALVGERLRGFLVFGKLADADRKSAPAIGAEAAVAAARSPRGAGGPAVAAGDGCIVTAPAGEQARVECQLQPPPGQHAHSRSGPALADVAASDPRAVDLLTQARNAADAGALHDAYRLAVTAAERAPLAWDTQLLCGIIAEELGYRDAAMTSFQRVLYLQPGHPVALLRMGLLRGINGEREAARRLLTCARDSLERHADLVDPARDGVSALELREMAELHLRRWSDAP